MLNLLMHAVGDMRRSVQVLGSLVLLAWVTGVTPEAYEDTAIRMQLTPLGDYSSALSHPLYAGLMNSTPTWLDYKPTRPSSISVLETTFQFHLDLRGMYVQDAQLNVSCRDIETWINSNWIKSSRSVPQCRGLSEHDGIKDCIRLVVVNPPPRCQNLSVDVIRFYRHTQEYMAMYEKMTFCNNGDFNVQSAMGHLRDYLSCGSNPELYEVRVDVMVASYGGERELSEETLHQMKKALAGVTSMVKLSTQLVKRCEEDLSCNQTCYSARDRCNFQLECVGGEDELGCWTKPPSLAGESNNEEVPLGQSALSPSGYRCDFEPYGKGFENYHRCPWKARSFKVETGTVAKTSTLPRKDATEKSQKGHFLYSSPATWENTAVQPFVASTCLGSTGPRCRLKFSYIAYHMSNLTVSRTASCRSQLIDQPYFLIEPALYSSNGTIWEKANVFIGEHEASFRLVLEANFSTKGYVAIDGLELENCQKDIEDIEGCTEDQFQCKSHKCISRDRMCNLDRDCIAGGDESHEICKQIPSFGMTDFNCDMEKGQCGWHNGPDNGPFNWTIRSHGNGNYTGVNMVNRRGFEHSVLNSVIFGPVRNTDRGQCKTRSKERRKGLEFVPEIRFFVYKSKPAYRLDLLLLAEAAEPQTLISIKHDTKTWDYHVVKIPEVNSRYHLQFKAYRGYKPRGQIALDDITLSPECFKIFSFAHGGRCYFHFSEKSMCSHDSCRCTDLMIYLCDYECA